MTRLRLHFLCTLLLVTPALAIEIEPIGPGAWAAIQPAAGRFDDSNSLIVAAEEFVIVVDAQENADDARRIIQFAREEIKKPVRYVINTHWHSDHTRSNTIYRREYGESLFIIGHRTHLEDIPNRAAPYLQSRVENISRLLPPAKAQLESGVKSDGSAFTPQERAQQSARIEQAETWLADNREVEFTVPTIAIASPYKVRAGAATFTVYPMRGHTRGDLVVHFAELSILATGDLVDELPFVGHGYPAAWLAALPEIDALQAKIMVPGHGSLMRDRVLLTRLDLFFGELISKVRTMIADGKDLPSIQSEIDLSASRRRLVGDDEAAGRFFDQVLPEAVQRAYEEATDTID